MLLAHCASFVDTYVCSAWYTALQMKNSTRNFTAGCFEKFEQKYDKARGKLYLAITNSDFVL